MLCIFPEGGSNDKTKLLPFKPGYAFIYYEALKKGIHPVILPVGINYRNVHKIRSSIIYNIGKPLDIDPNTFEE